MVVAFVSIKRRVSEDLSAEQLRKLNMHHCHAVGRLRALMSQGFCPLEGMVQFPPEALPYFLDSLAQIEADTQNKISDAFPGAEIGLLAWFSEIGIGGEEVRLSSEHRAYMRKLSAPTELIPGEDPVRSLSYVSALLTEAALLLESPFPGGESWVQELKRLYLAIDRHGDDVPYCAFLADRLGAIMASIGFASAEERDQEISKICQEIGEAALAEAVPVPGIAKLAKLCSSGKSGRSRSGKPVGKKALTLENHQERLRTLPLQIAAASQRMGASDATEEDRMEAFAVINRLTAQLQRSQRAVCGSKKTIGRDAS